MTEKRTKKQIEEELKETVADLASATEKNEALVAQYNELLSQAQAVQAVSNNRLMSIRLLENFANTVLAAGTQLRNDMNELNLVQQQSAETESDGGEQ
jgi:ABC-type hemin transport system substrate-binding protein|tara:strand:- start:3698 stop:3991 length:294 start_codon:yes stop_codon:yes gene_type:complete